MLLLGSRPPRVGIPQPLRQGVDHLDESGIEIAYIVLPHKAALQPHVVALEGGHHVPYARLDSGTVESLYSLPSERSVFHKFVDAPEADFESFFAVLAPLERMIVEMTYIGGFSTEEISTVIGISPNAIRKRRHFAITKMRKLCSGHE